MSRDAVFDEINDARANMDDIYYWPDPRACFRELKKLGYAIPGAAGLIFEKLISRLRARQDDTRLPYLLAGAWHVFGRPEAP